MSQSKSLDEFLANNKISNESWERSNSVWSDLQAISNDHESNYDHLFRSADLVANIIQKFEYVHSVRWRVKNSDHLIEKIVRKRAENSEKYLRITADNYYEIVTDLVGIRVLQLFKDECFNFDKEFRKTWNPIEIPVAYIRTGDQGDLKERFLEEGFEIKEHPAGYRSVHYVIASTPIQRKVIAEIQVRTIFEEGWSEIDHKIRYPNLPKSELIDYFLATFNRMAGNADEMGGFVRNLTSTLQDLESQVSDANNEKQKSLETVDMALIQLENANQQNKEAKRNIAILKAEIDKIRQASELNAPSSASAKFPIRGPRGSMQRIMEEMNRSNGISKSLELGHAMKSIELNALEKLALIRRNEVDLKKL